MEAAVSTVIVGLLVVAALGTVGATRRSVQQMGDYKRGALLAQQLMAEILQQSYEDPTEPVVLGLELSEVGLTRLAFDDVDDYHNWSASPPQNKDGTVIPDLTGWRHSVVVERVSPTNLSQTAISESGVKRITVTVSVNDVEVASLVALRTAAWQGPLSNR